MCVRGRSSVLKIYSSGTELQVTPSPIQGSIKWVYTIKNKRKRSYFGIVTAVILLLNCFLALQFFNILVIDLIFFRVWDVYVELRRLGKGLWQHVNGKCRNLTEAKGAKTKKKKKP